jgi:hypothetical protein
MKKTTKTNQLRLVRNAIRQLTKSDLEGVNGGVGQATAGTCGGTCHPVSINCCNSNNASD